MKKGRGNGVVRALGETRDEFDAFWIDGPTGTHSDDDEAHAGGKITILLTARARGDSQVSRKARAISVIGSDVCWASSIKGLDVISQTKSIPLRHLRPLPSSPAGFRSTFDTLTYGCLLFMYRLDLT